MFRITFFGIPTSGDQTEVSVRIILKSFPANIARRKTFRSDTFFSNEIKFYEVILPALLDFQAGKTVTDPFVSCPKVFASISNGDDDFLALEDLGIHGYGNAVRQEGIDYPHCKKILETFAKFHALSFAFKDQHPEEYKKIAALVPEVYYNPKYWEWYKGFWNLLCICSIDAIEKEYPNTIYEKKVKEFATDATYLKMIKAADSNAKSAVIGHGDSWTPNFLFKYQEGTTLPTDSMMIDFQLARSASPILDVAFFIYACSSQELRNDKYDDMLKYYHGVLSTQIKEMGSDPEKVYSWADFMDEVKNLSYFGVGFSMESTPVIILPPEEAFEMDSITVSYFSNTIIFF